MRYIACLIVSIDIKSFLMRMLQENCATGRFTGGTNTLVKSPPGHVLGIWRYSSVGKGSRTRPIKCSSTGIYDRIRLLIIAGYIYIGYRSPFDINCKLQLLLQQDVTERG